MPRPPRSSVDTGLLDAAAALFARRGAKTSLQDVADAVGLSKAGLLHHFPSKDALLAAVLAQARAMGQAVLDDVRDLAPGPARDRRALEVLVDVALAHPGLVALLLAPAVQAPGLGDDAGTTDAAAPVLQAFGVDPEACEPERLVRVVGALAALAVLTLTAAADGTATTWRPLVVATCVDALGSPFPRSTEA